ncbi:MAG TPA: patatin-like phospholipase family protein [Acidimicrobiales bacterium]|nr:patatin-like phospholipase family protein [Acidimicrobiales bacterium]HLN43867.1 patatin-like phospholipase family protein [Acidimicrobiales bacterium]
MTTASPVLPGGVFMGPGGARRLAGPGNSRKWLARYRRARVLRRRVRTAFVFAGGGARGSAQIGMLQALVARGITADAVYGASVGAINAAGYCGQPTAAGVDKLAERWRSVTREDVFPQGRFPTPWRFFQQRESVHPHNGIRKIIEDGIVFERLEDSPIPLEVVATSLTDGRMRWFSEGPAVERIQASAALPALLPPVDIDGETFIDGGVVDNVPIGRAIAQGAERIFVLLCGPLHYTPHRYRRPIEGVLTAFFIAVHARFARELEHLPEGVEVVVITVDTEPVSRYDDFSATDTLIAAGRANANMVLDFWESGGIGDTFGPGPAPAEPATAEPAAEMADLAGPRGEAV